MPIAVGGFIAAAPFASSSAMPTKLDILFVPTLRQGLNVWRVDDTDFVSAHFSGRRERGPAETRPDAGEKDLYGFMSVPCFYFDLVYDESETCQSRSFR